MYAFMPMIGTAELRIMGIGGHHLCTVALPHGSTWRKVKEEIEKCYKVTEKLRPASKAVVREVVVPRAAEARRRPSGPPRAGRSARAGPPSGCGSR